jgi:molybdopterin synthase catalytic subunit
MKWRSIHLSLAANMQIVISPQDFDLVAEHHALSSTINTGAVAMFSGQVRPQGEHGQLVAMELEHYPGMTEASIKNIIEEAEQRWSINEVRVTHRVGHLLPGDNIVFVGVAATHRAAAFAACEFVMDYLKTRAPFWKKEITQTGEFWIEQKLSDKQATHRWQIATNATNPGQTPS